MKPCLGTGGTAAVDEVCPQMSGKESCSQDGEQSLAVFAAVLASYKQIHEHVSRTTALKSIVQNNQQVINKWFQTLHEEYLNG